MHPLSIKTKICAVTTLSIVLAAALFVGIYVADQTSRMREFEQGLLNDSVKDAAAISYTIMPALLEKDFTRMIDLVSYYSKSSDRLYVAIVDNDNRIMAHSAGNEMGSPFEPPAVSETEKIKDGVVRRYLKAGEQSIEVSYPIKAGDLVLGAVRIGLNTDWIRNQTGKMRRTIFVSLGAALAIIILGIVITAAIAKRISEPIILLKEAAERIGRGDYDQRIDIKSSDEIGVLADAFNRMARDLRETRSQLVEKEALRMSEARLNEAQRIAHVGTWGWDISTNVLNWSDELFRIYGFEPGSIAPDYDLVLAQMHPESKDEFMNAIDAALKEDRHFEMDYRFFKKDGTVAVLHTLGKVFRDASGAPVRMQGIVQDITARWRAEEALRGSEEKLRTFFESANDAIFMLDLEGNFIDVNKAAHERLGYSREEMLSMNLAHLDSPDFAAKVPERIRQVVTQGQVVFEAAHMRKDGSVMPVEVNSRAIDLRGKQVIFSVIRDITERKAADGKINSALAEKETLLKEIHHRVKNNLQIVSSMLHLQSGYIKGDEAKGLFEESKKRIDAMSLIHEKLYRSKDLARVDFREYVDGLICNLSALSAEDYDRIEMRAEIEGVILDVDNSIPCGLIINELITNALRHAFPDGRPGEITIGMYIDGEGRVVLSISDDGIGFPRDIDFRSTQSLGLQLVTTLVGQINGVIELDRSRGTSFKVVFQA